MPNHIKDYRKLRGFTKKEVANAMKIPISTYTKWEEAEDAALVPADWLALAEVLGCKIEDMCALNTPQSYLYWR